MSSNSKSINVDELSKLIRAAVKLEHPPQEEGWFEKWPRVLLRWAMLILIVIATLAGPEGWFKIGVDKYLILAGLVASVYGIREAGQYLKDKIDKTHRYSNPEYRPEPIVDYEEFK